MPRDWTLTLFSVALASMMTPCRVASAQIVDVFGQVQTRLSRGDEVSVTDIAGRPTTGTVADVSALSLQLWIDGERRTFDAADVRQIDRRIADSVKNGVLWGLAIGAGAGLLGIVAAGHGGAGLDSAATIGPVALIVGPAAGAAIGGAVDASKVGREVIYTRIGSASNRRGFSWRWDAGPFDVTFGMNF